LEDRLSDILHEKLMARFVDRRTSALMRGLRVREDVLAGVSGDGTVTVEGHFVGRLAGVAFEAARGSSALEEKALRAAARTAVAPEITRRLGRLAADADEAFALGADGAVLWRGEIAGVISGGEALRPRVRLVGDLGPDAARQRATQRLEAFLGEEARRRLAALHGLETALSEGRLRGLARGLAFQLIEAAGVLDRAAVSDAVRALSPAERRGLRALGVRLGAFSVFLPGILAPRARQLTETLARIDAGGWRPPTDRPSRLPAQTPSGRVLAARGLRAVRGLAVPVLQLERLDDLLRAAQRVSGGVRVTPGMMTELGWREDDARAILKGLGFNASGKPDTEGQIWRRRAERDFRVEHKAAAAPHSPFAALAALRPAQAPARRPRRRKSATSP
jgi:ATP-dependent RNA helicase SUPV3L1/SUV3